MATARVAEANRELVVRNLTSPATPSATSPTGSCRPPSSCCRWGPILVYAFQANLLEQVKRDVIGAADLASGEIGGVVERTVCFADLVEFTSLGEEIATEELGVVVGHFEELATSVVAAPVRLVKTIGDAVMLVSPEAEPLVAAALDLVAAAAAEGDQFPVLRAGIATGPTLATGGRLLRPLGQPGEPRHRHRPPWQRPRRHSDPGRRRRGRLRLLLRRRAPPQGHRLPPETLPRPPAEGERRRKVLGRADE